jgi:hypothetical protein
LTELEERVSDQFLEYRPSSFEKFRLAPIHFPSDRLLRSFTFENPQVNSEYQEHCEICIRQRNAHNEMYAYEHQLLSEGKAIPAAESSQQGIPAYPNVPEFRGKTISAVDQQKNGSAGYLSLSDFGINFENAMGVDMSDPRERHAIGAERNTIVSQSSVFSRLSPSQQPPSQEFTGPTLSQLVSAFSQKAKKWSDEKGPVVDGFSYMIREQATDRPYSHCKLNLPSNLELEAEAGESTESQAPFLNFKRHSEARNANANLGKEINGKLKKRKLVRRLLKKSVLLLLRELANRKRSITS